MLVKSCYEYIEMGLSLRILVSMVEGVNAETVKLEI